MSPDVQRQYGALVAESLLVGCNHGKMLLTRLKTDNPEFDGLDDTITWQISQAQNHWLQVRADFGLSVASIFHFDERDVLSMFF